MTALDATAQNLAGSTTPGYKADKAVFQEHLVRAAFVGQSRESMRYNGVAGVDTDLAAGPLKVTQRPLDVAVAGDGYFVVRTESGDRYTRAGAFHLDPTGTLVTPQGQPVLSPAGQPVQVGADGLDVAIGEDGVLRAGDEEYGSLSVVRFANPDALAKEGSQLFRAPREAGAPEVVPTTLHAGALEMPNVSVVKGMTDLVSASRALETLQRAVEVFSDLERRAATDIVGAR
jgi:flagellar basal body rod protein FlgG